LSCAAEQFALAAKWNPQLEEIHFNWGLACYKAELYQQAIPPLEHAVELCRAIPAPSLLDVPAAHLGYAYALAGRLPEGIALLEEAVADPEAGEQQLKMPVG